MNSKTNNPLWDPEEARRDLDRLKRQGQLKIIGLIIISILLSLFLVWYWFF